MKKICLINAKKFLFNSLGFLICMLPIACKKLSNYSPTIVVGKVTNVATGQGIPNALIVLKAYGNGFTLPEKANIEAETRTDSEGNYRFEFDAYAAVFNGRKTAVYSVQYYTEGKLIEWFAGEGQGSTINLRDFYKDDLLTFDNPLNLGGFNLVNINVVMAGRVFFQFFNDKPGASISDTLELRVINQYLEYYQYGLVGTEIANENNLLSNHPFTLVTGNNTLRFILSKNSQVQILDTTFFVEAKDYYINYHY